MLDFDKSLCVGCTACLTVCPKDAIRITSSEEGFYISTIDNNKCISCGLCEQVCPVLNDNTIQYVIEEYSFCFCKSETDRLSAASGGVFGELAKATIEVGGLVCSCIWDDDFKAKHIVTDNMDDIIKMKGSKYVQSDLNHIFMIIKTEIKKRKILFVGTPCQTTALSRVIGDSPNLLLCALVCGGSPSPFVWEKYMQVLKTTSKEEIIGVNHRCKKNGWLSQTIEIKYANGTIKHIPTALDSFARAFFCALSIGHFCEMCNFKWGNFVADIVIGDGWGANKEILRTSKNKGVSSVVLLSDKGKICWKSVASHFQIYPCTKEDFYAHHKVIFQRKTPNPHRTSFFEALNRIDILDNFKQNVPPRKHTFVNKILNKFGLYGLVYNVVSYWRAK